MKKFNFIDLFSGCGGLSEGFYNSGFKALAHVEIDPTACKTLKARMKFYKYKPEDVHVFQKDIRDENIIKDISRIKKNDNIDIIIGGPPCQSYSSLGRAKDPKSMKDDPRNTLFESYERILNFFKPKVFVFENVMGLLSAKIGSEKTINIILKKLGKNYNLINDPDLMVLNSCDYGVPQIRRRVFIIGIRKDFNEKAETIYENIIKTHFPNGSKNKSKYVTVSEAISDLPKLFPGEGLEHRKFKIDKWNPFLKNIRPKNFEYLYNHVARTHNKDDRMRYKYMAENMCNFKELLAQRPDLNHDRKRVFNNSYVVQFWNKPSKTIIAHLYKDGNQFIHPDHEQERTLTAREAARIQSFSDDFFFEGSRTQQYKQIGNAVPPLLSKAIAKSVKKFLEKNHG